MITAGGVLPLAVKRRQLAPARNKLPAEGRKCANNMLSIFCEHRLIVNRFYRYQIGFHRTFLPVAAFRRSSKQFHHRSNRGLLAFHFHSMALPRQRLDGLHLADTLF
jgi:hypothetical protein